MFCALDRRHRSASASTTYTPSAADTTNAAAAVPAGTQTFTPVSRPSVTVAGGVVRRADRFLQRDGDDAVAAGDAVEPIDARRPRRSATPPGDHHAEGRHRRGGPADFFEDDGDLERAEAAAADFLRHVDADDAGVGQGLPQPEIESVLARRCGLLAVVGDPLGEDAVGELAELVLLC